VERGAQRQWGSAADVFDDSKSGSKLPGSVGVTESSTITIHKPDQCPRGPGIDKHVEQAAGSLGRKADGAA
jgi:hypothetical protein